MEELHLVKYSEGSWDDYREVSVFVTYDIETAQAWVTKFNLKLAHWKEVMRTYCDEYEDLTDESWGTIPITRRYYQIMAIDLAWVERISIR